MKGKFGARCPSELVGVFKCTGRTPVLFFPRREQAGVQDLWQRFAGLDDFKDVAASQRIPISIERSRCDGEKLASLGLREDVAHLAALGYHRCAHGLAFWFNHGNWLPSGAERHHSRFAFDETRAAPKSFDRNVAEASPACRAPRPEMRIRTVWASRFNRKQRRPAE